VRVGLVKRNAARPRTHTEHKQLLSLAAQFHNTSYQSTCASCPPVVALRHEGFAAAPSTPALASAGAHSGAWGTRQLRSPASISATAPRYGFGVCRYLRGACGPIPQWYSGT
jgi:hypothetical protein